MTIPIVFGTDDNYVLPLSVAIQSLKNHKKSDIALKIYVLYNKLSQDNINVMSSLNDNTCQVAFVNVTDFFKGKNIYATSYFSVAMYYRLVAPLLLKQYGKIFYLDCDIIVKRGGGACRSCIKPICKIMLLLP